MSCFFAVPCCFKPGGGGGGYSGFQVTVMIEWSQKSRPKKIHRVSSKTQKKSLDHKLTPKKSHADLVGIPVTEKPVDCIEVVEVLYTAGHHGTMQTIV